MAPMAATSSQQQPRFGEKEALLFAGCIGGPFTIWMYTPLRNAITLGSQAPNAATHPASGLYREVFSRGFVGGWTGCVTTVAMSSVQFACMGPLYHVYMHYLGAAAAVPLTAVTESCITYGSQTRNAQMAYNVTVPAARRLVVQNPLNPLGVGFAVHAARNTVAMTGSRLIVGPCTSAISAATTAVGAYPGKGACEIAGDFSGCVVAAALSVATHTHHHASIPTHASNRSMCGCRCRSTSASTSSSPQTQPRSRAESSAPAPHSSSHSTSIPREACRRRSHGNFKQHSSPRIDLPGMFLIDCLWFQGCLHACCVHRATADDVQVHTHSPRQLDFLGWF